MLKLDLMQKECLEEKLNEEKEAIKDEFIVYVCRVAVGLGWPYTPKSTSFLARTFGY